MCMPTPAKKAGPRPPAGDKDPKDCESVPPIDVDDAQIEEPKDNAFRRDSQEE